MDATEIIKDFEELKNEIYKFIEKPTIDDYYFLNQTNYYRDTVNPIKEFVNNECNKHFETTWSNLPHFLIDKYFEASLDANKEELETINTLGTFLFNVNFKFLDKEEKKEQLVNERKDWHERYLIKKSDKISKNYRICVFESNNEGSYEKFINSVINLEKPLVKNTIPKNWKLIVTGFINVNWEKFSGIQYQNSINTDRNKMLELEDYANFLALKNALRNNLQVITHSKEILFVLASGIMAKFSFRKTGNYVLKLKKSKREIYSKTHFSEYGEKEYQYAPKSLLHVNGYSKSTIDLQISNGYYFVDDDYVVEIDFIAAPILLNSFHPFIASMDQSSEERIDDEEEEERRRMDDD
jgi:hypothetical protein